MGVAWNKGMKFGPLTEEQKKKVSLSLKGVNTWSKGRSLSEDHKRKLSETHKRIGNKPPNVKGIKRSAETRAKISIFQKGRKKTPEHVEKIRLANVGKPSPFKGIKTGPNLKLRGRKNPTQSERQKGINNPMFNRRGNLNPAWKGGRTSLVQSIRHTFQYRQWRSDVFTRDNFTCIHCGDNKGGNLQADHVKPFLAILLEYNIDSSEKAVKCEELWNINNGRTLCYACHTKTPTFGSKVFNFIKK